MSMPPLVALLVGIGVAAAAQSAPPKPPEPAVAEGQFSAIEIAPGSNQVSGRITAPRRKQPAAILFVPLPQSPAAGGGTERSPLQPLRPEVRCGIKVFPADPAVDPRIAMPVPNGSVDYKIRSVQSPPCDE